MLVELLALLGAQMGCGEGPAAPSAPHAPTGVSVSPHRARITVTWNPVDGADRYNVYWATTPGITKAKGTRVAGVASPFEHQNLTNGTAYYYVVTAENGVGESGVSAEVSAVPVNAVPRANAGADQSVATGVTVTLDGSGSDADADPLTYVWTQVSGPTVSLSDPKVARPTFTTPRRLGALRFSLAVSDADTASGFNDTQGHADGAKRKSWHS